MRKAFKPLALLAASTAILSTPAIAQDARQRLAARIVSDVTLWREAVYGEIEAGRTARMSSRTNLLQIRAEATVTAAADVIAVDPGDLFDRIQKACPLASPATMANGARYADHLTRAAAVVE